MDINKFMFKLNKALSENLFTNVEIHRIYSDTDDVVVIRVICDRNNRHYDYSYSVSRYLLDSISIDKIINCLLNI